MWKFCLLFSLCSIAVAQECATQDRAASTPETNFVINNDGTVTELETGLTWMRCAVGQEWKGGRCVGEGRRFTWSDASRVTQSITVPSETAANWRLPTLPELASIVERQCKHPRINLKIFPDTPADRFWTGTHQRNSDEKVYAMDFNEQGVIAVEEENTLFVRLVYGR
jgi:hypothetical protein